MTLPTNPITAANVRLANKHDRGYAIGMFSVDLTIADGRVFHDALTVPVTRDGVQRGGQCSAEWSDAIWSDTVTEAEAEAAWTAAVEAVQRAAVAWPLAKVSRTLGRVEKQNADGNFPVQWELTCPHCGSPTWEHTDDRGSWGILRCTNGHLSKVAILQSNGEKLFTVPEAK